MSTSRLTHTMATPHLLRLPGELRQKIWELLFENVHAVPSQYTDVPRERSCHSCSKDQRPLPITWNRTFEPLLTCKQIYHEAHDMLLSGMVIELRKGIFDFSWLTWPIAPINHKIRRLIVWAHIGDDNRRQWISTFNLIGTAFPALDSLLIKAHMRPPDGYETLTDAIALALPVVRLNRNKTTPEITLEFDYEYHSSMFRSPELGEITSYDMIEEHELLVRDLIEDDGFVEAALADQEDMQALTAALLRVSRAHEQPWYDNLARRRQERRRLREREQSGEQAEGEEFE